MIRTVVVALIFCCTMAVSAQAAVSVFSSPGVPVPNLPGYRSFKLTAISDVAGEPVSIINFRGFTNQNDPATDLGFFGPLNQITVGGNPTIFEDFFDIGSQFDEARAQDSHFLFSTLDEDFFAISVFAQEGPELLRAEMGMLPIDTTGFGQSVEFVQLVLPPFATVNYRGEFSVVRGGASIALPAVQGVISNTVPEFPESTIGFVAGLGVIGLTCVPRPYRYVVLLDGREQ